MDYLKKINNGNVHKSGTNGLTNLFSVKSVTRR